MRSLVIAYVGVSIVGAVHAVRRGRPARVAGVRLPGAPRTHALTIGTPLSAPPMLLVALVVAASRRRTDVTAALCGLFLVGIAGEADTFATIRRPNVDVISTGCVAMEAFLPAAILLRARSAR